MIYGQLLLRCLLALPPLGHGGWGSSSSTSTSNISIFCLHAQGALSSLFGGGLRHNIRPGKVVLRCCRDPSSGLQARDPPACRGHMYIASSPEPTTTRAGITKSFGPSPRTTSTQVLIALMYCKALLTGPDVVMSTTYHVL